MTVKFFDCCEEKTAEYLFVFMRTTYCGNIPGNRWYAVLSRFKRNPAENSSCIVELLFFLLTFWFIGPAILQVKDVKN